MVQEEGARCLPVLALLALSRKRGVGPLGFCWKPGSPAGTSWDASEPLPGSGELPESMFLAQLFFLQEAEEILVQKWKRTLSAKLLILLPMETEGSLPLCCDSALNFQVYFYAQIWQSTEG